MSGARAQVWIEPRGEDPEADSALAVARARLEAGRGLRTLRRVRLIELHGALPEAAELARHLHASTQFYNPAKERAAIRMRDGDPAPLQPGEIAILVHERGGERRAAAERWWKRAVGGRAEVREARVWIAVFEPGEPAETRARELAVLEDRAHGLLCNPHVEGCAVATELPPLAWIPSGRRS